MSLIHVRSSGFDPRFPGRRRVAALQSAGFLGFAGLWELISRSELVPSRFLPPFSAVAGRFVELLTTGDFWSDIYATMRAWAIGLSIAIVAGIVLGLLVGSSAFLAESTRFVVDFLRSVPAVALIPLLIVQFGATEKTKLILIVYGAIFPVLIGAIFGAGAVDQGDRDVAKVFGLRSTTGYFKVTLPAAAPFIMTGIKVSASIGVIVAVVVEILTGAEGVGAGMTTARQGQDFEAVYALILAAGVLGVLVNAFVKAFEPLVLSWHPSVRLHR